MADNLESQQAAKREARKQAQEENRKAMEEQRGERQLQNEAAMKRMESSQPTPTQEENDLAKLGVAVEKKADDKSGRTIITPNVVIANEPLGLHGYETKDAREARKAHEDHTRQREETHRQEQQSRR